jgi:hypothetical protein
VLIRPSLVSSPTFLYISVLLSPSLLPSLLTTRYHLLSSNRKCVADGAKVIDMIDTGDDEAFGGQMDELQAAIKAITGKK